MKIDLIQELKTKKIFNLELKNFVDNYILFNNKELTVLYDNKKQSLVYKNYFGLGHNLMLFGLLLVLCELLKIKVKDIEFYLIENSNINLYQLFRLKNKQIKFFRKELTCLQVILEEYSINNNFNFSHNFFHKEFFNRFKNYFTILRKIFSKYFNFSDQILEAVDVIKRKYSINLNYTILWWRRTDTNKYLFPEKIDDLKLLKRYLPDSVFLISDDVEVRKYFKEYKCDTLLPLPRKVIDRWRDGDSNLYFRNTNLEYLKNYKQTKLDYYKFLFAYILLSTQCRRFVGYVGVLSIFINCIRKKSNTFLYSFKIQDTVVAR